MNQKLADKLYSEAIKRLKDAWFGGWGVDKDDVAIRLGGSSYSTVKSGIS